MTAGQERRVKDLAADGGDVQIVSIPDGSILAVRRTFGRTWIEVVEPEPTSLQAFDFGD